MSGRIARLPSPPTPASAPSFEVRTVRHGPADTEVEVWQLPSPASPQLTAPVLLASLRGRNLGLVEHRVLKLLAAAGLKFSPRAGRKEALILPEDQALRLGLLFRALAPMRSRDNIRAVAEGIEAMLATGVSGATNDAIAVAQPTARPPLPHSALQPAAGFVG